jgi:hypothetical protein
MERVVLSDSDHYFLYLLHDKRVAECTVLIHWLSSPEEVTPQGQIFGTRLVTYHARVKVDFVRYLADVLRAFPHSNPWPGHYDLLR